MPTQNGRLALRIEAMRANPLEDYGRLVLVLALMKKLKLNLVLADNDPYFNWLRLSDGWLHLFCKTEKNSTEDHTTSHMWWSHNKKKSISMRHILTWRSITPRHTLFYSLPACGSSRTSLAKGQQSFVRSYTFAIHLPYSYMRHMPSSRWSTVWNQIDFKTKYWVIYRAVIKNALSERN